MSNPIGEPGQELNLAALPGQGAAGGRETPARQAATVILLRDRAQKLEVLLVRRTPQARFMGGVWVFPGGAVDASEGDGDDAHRAAAKLEERAVVAGQHFVMIERNFLGHRERPDYIARFVEGAIG